MTRLFCLGGSEIQLWHWVLHSHLKKSLGYSDGAGDMVIFSPDWHPQILGNLAISAVRDHPVGMPHQLSGRNQKFCHNKGSRLDPILGLFLFGLLYTFRAYTFVRQTSSADIIRTHGSGPYIQLCSGPVLQVVGCWMWTIRFPASTTKWTDLPLSIGIL